jgi:predicted 2-oxoglutarate/Fe(II)-dependent dioxygenase YbiX
MTLMTRPRFEHARNAPCFCGSGEKFRRCCGSLSPDRQPPHGVVVKENYLSRDQCRKLLDIIEKQGSGWLKVMDLEKTTRETTVNKVDENRVTELVDMEEHQGMLNDLVANLIIEEIEPGTGTRIEWFEEPQILKYKPGGFYASHADSESYDNQLDAWVKVLDRDWSLLLYLNDEYEGGEIRFNKFNFEVKPKAGTLIYFPADGRYMHTALPVTSGVRYALVSWMSQEGVEKIRAPSEYTVRLRPD